MCLFALFSIFYKSRFFFSPSPWHEISKGDVCLILWAGWYYCAVCMWLSVPHMYVLLGLHSTVVSPSFWTSLRGFWPFVFTHFETPVSTAHDWVWRIRMRLHGWWDGLFYSSALCTDHSQLGRLLSFNKGVWLLPCLMELDSPSTTLCIY